MKNTYHLKPGLETEIAAELEKLPVIDCHEHLCSEKKRLASHVDFMTLFSHYCYHDIHTEGLPPEEQRKLYSGISPEEKWRIFKPVYQNIRYTSYSRAAHLALEKFYGETELNDGNVVAISEKMRAWNTPGIYSRIFTQACNIKTCLAQNGEYDERVDGLMTHVRGWMGPVNCYKKLSDTYCGVLGRELLSLDDLAEAARLHVSDAKKKGCVGIKIGSMPREGTSWMRANEYFRKLKNEPEREFAPFNPLTEFVTDQIVEAAGAEDLVVCAHTGYWSDFRELSPENMIDVADRYPDIKFDIYHLGYPYMREAIMLAKSRPNVWTNMAWTYIISQKFAYDGLDELLDMVPVNKILGFGADYHIIEKVYGHMVMCIEVMARVLAGKVDKGLMSFVQAVSCAEKMFYHNPKELYKLEV